MPSLIIDPIAIPIAAFCGALIGLGAGAVLGWSSGYLACAFAVWKGRA